jgi:hypothetical protein
METLQIKIFNSATGEEVVRNMNAEELKQLEIDKAEAKSEAKAKADKAAAKEAAQAKLAALGLTVEDLTALGL